MKNRKKVVLTQSEGKLKGLKEALEARGYEVLHSPLIRTEPVLDEHTRQLAEEMLQYPWVLFASPAAVEAWRALSLPLKDIEPNIGVVGKQTAKLVESYGGEVELVAEAQNAKSLARTLIDEAQEPEAVGLPQGDRALPTLEHELERAGIETHTAVIYETETQPLKPEARKADIVVLASPSAVKALPASVARDASLVTLGPTTQQAVRSQGWQAVQAEAPEVEAVVEAVEDAALEDVY